MRADDNRQGHCSPEWNSFLMGLNILNVNTGSDASSYGCIFVISSGSTSRTQSLSPCDLPFTPSSSEYQKHRPRFKLGRMCSGGRVRGSRAPQAVLPTRISGWEGEVGGVQISSLQNMYELREMEWWLLWTQCSFVYIQSSLDSTSRDIWAVFKNSHMYHAN